MAEAPEKDPANLPSGDDNDQPHEELNTLRHLIVGPEKDRVSQLEQRLDDATTRAKEVSRVLPDALVISTAKDQRIARSLQPTIESAIRSSVRRNPKVLADAIFPLMGPGMRKAITATIMGMIQSFNQLLNHSFSIQGLKWRLEALRTRKPYAEIVLLHTLLYQVEQVLLIHRQNGLVLQHVVGPSVKFQDPDLVSGMLTAIEDFVHDSFHVASDQSLDTLRIGSDRSVWIEQGPKAMLAGVIRGTPPLELRHRMAEILNVIHLKYSRELEAYDGDSTAFEDARDDLQSCLDSQFKPATDQSSPLLWIASIALVVLLSVWAFVSFNQRQRLDAFLAALQNQPGIMITATQRHGNQLLISGLKDPLVEVPEALDQSHGLTAGRIAYHWRPYVSLEPQLILERAQRLLQPPPAVSLVLDGDTLVAGGEAGHRWIQDFDALARTVVGINHTRADQLIDSDLLALKTVRQRMETTRILFAVRSSAIAPDQALILTKLSHDLHLIEKLAKRFDRPFGIRIVGYTDNSGTESANLKLSRDRAEAVRRFLIDTSNLKIEMTAIGMGPRETVSGVNDKSHRANSRFAGFELVNDTGFRQGND